MNSRLSFPFLIHFSFLSHSPFKARTTSHNWDAADEQEFTNMLEGELDKIHDFQKAKVCVIAALWYLSLRNSSYFIQTAELSNRIKIAEKQVKKLVSEEFATTPSPTRHRVQEPSAPDAEDPEASRKRDTLHQDGGSDDDDTDEEDDTLATDDESTQSLDALEEQFRLLEEEVATLVADVHDLALYTKLNITGFMKILKASIPLFNITLLLTRTLNLPAETRRTWPRSIHAHFPPDLVHTPYRNKPRPPLLRLSFRITSRSALFTSTTGMQSSSNSPAYMTLFGRVATPCRVTLLPAVPRVPSYGRRQSIGYTLITSSRSNSRL